MMRLMALVCMGVAWFVQPATAQVRVNVPSLEGDASSPTLLPSVWFEAARDDSSADGRGPAVVLLHGCGGPYAANTAARERKQLSVRMRHYAEQFNRLGVHVLITDSLTPRGESELCTQKLGTRRVTQRERRGDALGALTWLSEHPRVDAKRLGLVGWSNGGSTVLAAVDATHPQVRSHAPRASLAIAFYPGCAATQVGFQANTPLLMLVGEADDWTPVAPCVELGRRVSDARRAGQADAGEAVDVVTYPGAVHGFDGTAPVQVRTDVPNGVRPGKGVHVGGQQAARDDSWQRIEQRVRERWFVAR